MVVMVSHDLNSIASLCDRVVWLDHGRMRAVGPAAEVIAAYQESTQEVPADQLQAA